MDKIVVCYSQRISENQIKNLYKTAKVTPIKLITTIKNLMGAGQPLQELPGIDLTPKNCTSYNVSLRAEKRE
ncbi:hypothetical protein ES708_00415 [subsurface metagenome]